MQLFKPRARTNGAWSPTPPTPPMRSSSRSVKEHAHAAKLMPQPNPKLQEGSRRSQNLQQLEQPVRRVPQSNLKLQEGIRCSQNHQQFEQTRRRVSQLSLNLQKVFRHTQEPKQLEQQYLGQQCRMPPIQSRVVALNRSNEESRDLYSSRIKFLRQTRAAQSNKRQAVGLLDAANCANSGVWQGQKTITTYNETSQSPSKDLQTLVLVMTRLQMIEEVRHLNNVVNEQNPFEMRNMRLKSFIANTQDFMDHWKTAMLVEGIRVIDESCELDEMAWVTPGTERKLETTLDEELLVSVPPDKPEISTSQVATEYIQAQRGHQGNEQEEFLHLFQNDLLKAENAAGASPEMFDRICNCYRIITQKIAEIECIESKAETVQAVANYIKKLKTSEDFVVQEAMTQHLVDAVEQGRTIVRTLVGQIMDELHSRHKQKNFEPMRVQIYVKKET